jgi:hypothetical protein
MTQIFITTQYYVKDEVVPVDDIKLGIRCRCVNSFVFQAHFTSEERALITHQTGSWKGIKLTLETISSSIKGQISEDEHPYGVLTSKVTRTVPYIHHVLLWHIQGIQGRMDQAQLCRNQQFNELIRHPTK